MASSFEQRRCLADLLVTAVKEELWEHEALRPLVVQEQFGSENYVRPEVHGKIRFTDTPTTRHVRFAPDYFVVDLPRPERTYLLEYKHTASPLSSASRLAELRRASRPDLQFEDVGQWEAAAYDNYLALASLQINVCVLNYAPFHPRPLLCESIRRVKPLYRSPGVGTTLKGSRTPWINFDLGTLRSLDQFLHDVHGLPLALVQPLVARALARLAAAEAGGPG